MVLSGTYENNPVVRFTTGLVYVFTVTTAFMIREAERLSEHHQNSCLDDF